MDMFRTRVYKYWLITNAVANKTKTEHDTCFGAGPDGMCTILAVTSTTRLSVENSEAAVPFSRQRCSRTPEQGERFVTKTKWFFPS